MHDIDRIQSETDPETDAFETDSFEFVEETDSASEREDSESVFNEVEEMELASQLLEVTDEAELDQFLGSLIRKAGRAVGRFVKSPMGQALGRTFKSLAKQALPIAGKMAGTYFGGPVGGAVGGQVGGAVGTSFELELEGLSPEDQEFEVARRYVRFAGSAVQKAVQAPPTVPPQTAVQSAVRSAARRHAPGLIRVVNPPVSPCPAVHERTGRWIRRGRKIILFGV